MKTANAESHGQERWDRYGQERLTAIQNDPDSFIIRDEFYSQLKPPHLRIYRSLQKSFVSLQGKKILEIGCGYGDFSVLLAKQGAEVVGIDIGSRLIPASQLLAEVNHVDCRFQESNINQLPFPDNSYDIVVGVAILHHVGQDDLRKACDESYRVLKDGGIAIFHEPVENSKLFHFMQTLFPVGKKGTEHFRPSVLQRKSWRSYMAAKDDRPLTNRELMSAGRRFKSIAIHPFGLLIRLRRLIGKKYGSMLTTIDDTLFTRFPSSRYLCKSVMVEYRK